MKINVHGYMKEINVDGMTGIYDIGSEAKRLVKEMELPESEVYRIMQLIQGEQLERYAKDFNL